MFVKPIHKCHKNILRQEAKLKLYKSRIETGLSTDFNCTVEEKQYMIKKKLLCIITIVHNIFICSEINIFDIIFTGNLEFS